MTSDELFQIFLNDELDKFVGQPNTPETLNSIKEICRQLLTLRDMFRQYNVIKIERNEFDSKLFNILLYLPDLNETKEGKT